MGRIVLIIFTVISLILVTIFGLGPVLLADGALTERLMVLGFVLVLYFLLIGLLRILLQKKK